MSEIVAYGTAVVLETGGLSMLRTVVIAVSAILTCVGIGLIACGVYAPGWQALVIGRDRPHRYAVRALAV